MRTFSLRSFIFVPALLVGFVANCLAAQGDCQNASTTAAMRACENARYEGANHKLEAAYSQLLTTLNPSRKEKLRAAESAWIQFREKNADFLASEAEGGTLAPLLRVGALADMTEERLKELTRLNKK
ncbi:MAG: DUF1311 domain-containing protein [Acidobacteriaceae bacterium]|nr:DUF1311 domain-containing protein [Acidobacteriaceae bacterium]